MPPASTLQWKAGGLGFFAILRHSPPSSVIIHFPAMSFRFDVHTHAFHPKIADKVVRQLEAHYHIPPIGSGCYEDLEPRLRRARLDFCCIHSAATKPEQVEPANNWAIALKAHPGVIPFGTMHPGYGHIEDELARLWDNGVRGIKLHPDFQGFRVDDPRLDRFFGAIEGHFTLMLHVGDVLPPAENPTCPYKTAALKRKYPKLQLIAAHFGGVHHWKYVIDAMKGMEIYMDTSSSLWTIEQPVLEAIFRAFPRHLFLYGSDYPLFDPADELQRLQRRLRLSDHEVEELLTNANALKLADGQAPLPQQSGEAGQG